MFQENNSKFSFRAVEVFIAVVEEGAVTAAAKRLGASASAISLQLSNLEAALGAKLIERSSQRFALTTAGEVFHPRALRIMDEITSASAVLSKSNTSSRMLLKLAMIEDFDSLVIPAWLTSVRQQFPKMRFHIKSGPSHESHAALGNRAADMIVAVDATEATDWVEDHPILNDPYILVRSNRIRSAESIDSLMRYPFIRYSREQLMGRQIEAHLRRSKSVPPREHEFSSNQAVFSMIEALGGWTITTVSAFSSISFTNRITSEPPALRASHLPIPAFSRCISLYARKDSLGDLPSIFADILRQSMNDSFVLPLKQKFSFINETSGFHILGDTEE
ncbi:MAG: LysR family transcriptional regulator [Pseudomonadota bacterium]